MWAVSCTCSYLFIVWLQVGASQQDPKDVAFEEEVKKGRPSHEYEMEGVGRKEELVPPEVKEKASHAHAAEAPPHN
jgi:hypothetical protein